jgi:transposase
VARALAHPGKKAVDEARTVVWIDQSGFYLLPMAVRTWARCGHTPMLHVPLTRDHLAAISGITADGRLFMQTQDHAYRSPDVVRFLRVLLRKIRGKLLVIWGGSPIHRGQPSKDFLRRGAAKRLHLEQLPGYAPELNPDEGIWNYLKRVELGNCCSRDLAGLALAMRRAKERLRHKRSVIQACFLQAGYHV